MVASPFADINMSASDIERMYNMGSAATVISTVYSAFSASNIALAIKNVYATTLCGQLLNYQNTNTPDIKTITQSIYSNATIISQLSNYDGVAATDAIFNSTPGLYDQIFTIMPDLYLQITGQYYADKTSIVLNATPYYTITQYLALIKSFYGIDQYNLFINSLCGSLSSTATPCDTYSENKNTIYLGEWFIYGSSRLGVKRARLKTCTNTFRITNNQPVILSTVDETIDQTVYTNYRGFTQYEISNHLGNVLTVVSDRKKGMGVTSTSTTFDHYEAEVISAKDYYVFGSPMPIRNFAKPDNSTTRFSITAILASTDAPLVLHRPNSMEDIQDNLTQYNSSFTTITQYVNDIVSNLRTLYPNNDITVNGNDITITPALVSPSFLAGGAYMQFKNGGSPYRFGFTGLEKDNEIKGDGNSYSTEFRIYDPRIATWLSVDPLTSKYPSNSPYNYTEGNPIVFNDRTGKGKESTIIDQKGVVVGGKIDGDAGVYMVGGLTKKTFDVNKMAEYKNDGVRIGTSASEYSFTGDLGKTFQGHVNFGSREAMVNIDYATSVFTKSHLFLNGNLNAFLDYKNNANNFQDYDIKSWGLPNGASETDRINNYYEASFGPKGLIFTKRDQGNYFAGYAASMMGIPWAFTASGFGALNGGKNSTDGIYVRTLINLVFYNGFKADYNLQYKEDKGSFDLQKLGFKNN